MTPEEIEVADVARDEQLARLASEQEELLEREWQIPEHEMFLQHDVGPSLDMGGP